MADISPAMRLTDLPLRWLCAAVRTMEAPRWKVTLARWFGRRFTGEDGGCQVIGYEWRGNLYMTDYRKIET